LERDFKMPGRLDESAPFLTNLSKSTCVKFSMNHPAG
jgi:hypothetical protein